VQLLFTESNMRYATQHTALGIFFFTCDTLLRVSDMNMSQHNNL